MTEAMERRLQQLQGEAEELSKELNKLDAQLQDPNNIAAKVKHARLTEELQAVKATRLRLIEGSSGLQLNVDQQRALNLLLARYDQEQVVLRPTTSYAASYDSNNHKRQKLDVALAHDHDSQRIPDMPSQLIQRIDKDENGVLLPLMLKLIRSLPGARSTKIQNRDAVTYNGVAFVDTHSMPFLDECAPDITLVPAGCNIASAVALGVLELQVGDLDKPHKGKVEHYLLALLDANPDRQMAKGVLFNGTDLMFFLAARSTPSNRLFESASFSLGQDATSGRKNWEFFWDFILCGDSPTGTLRHHYGWEPPKLQATFIGSANSTGTPQLLQLDAFIASSGTVRVWQVQGGRVCKHFGGSRAASYKRELHALLEVRSAECAEGKELWPVLLGNDEGQGVIVTQPLVKPLGVMTATTVHSLFAGLRFLHKQGLVHRDLEDKHVGQDDAGHTCVIDLSTCVPLARSEGLSSPGYAGTIVNASEDVLDALALGQQLQVPVCEQQDWVALVKTVYGLTHTSSLPRIHTLASQVALDLSNSMAIQPEPLVVENVRAFWQAEFNQASPAGRKWQALVDLAHVDTGGSGPEGVSRLEVGLSELVCPR